MINLYNPSDFKKNPWLFARFSFLDALLCSGDQKSDTRIALELGDSMVQDLSLNLFEDEAVKKVDLVVQPLSWLCSLSEFQVLETTEVFGRDYSGTLDSDLLTTLWVAWNGAFDAFCNRNPSFNRGYNQCVGSILKALDKKQSEILNLPAAVFLQLATHILSDENARKLFRCWRKRRSEQECSQK
mgnify:CR=1 FL=1